MSNGGLYISFESFDVSSVRRSDPYFFRLISEENLRYQEDMIHHPEILREDLITIMKTGYTDLIDEVLKKLKLSDAELREYAEEAFEMKNSCLISVMYKMNVINDNEIYEYLMNHDLSKESYFFQIILNVSTIYRNAELFYRIWNQNKHNMHWMFYGLRDFADIVHPNIYKFLEDQYLSGKFTNDTKKYYAALENGISEEIFYKLSHEKARPIIIALAGNKSLPSKLQWEFVGRFKTPNIREKICGVTNDKELLHHIYNTTTSKSIKNYAQSNPVF